MFLLCKVNCIFFFNIVKYIHIIFEYKNTSLKFYIWRETVYPLPTRNGHWARGGHPHVFVIRTVDHVILGKLKYPTKINE